jgi:hypothetical protein
MVSMLRKFVTGAAALLAALAVTAAALASSWHVAASKSASGDFAATAVSATVNHPNRIAVRFAGSGFAAWACSKGYSVSSYSRNFGSGFHELRHISGNSCQVTASVAGSRRVRVQILKR